MSDSINTVIEECAAESKALQQIKAAYPYAKRFDGRLVADDLKFEDCDIFEQREDMPTYVRFGRRFGSVILWQSRDKPVSLLCEVLLAPKTRKELAKAGW